MLSSSLEGSFKAQRAAGWGSRAVSPLLWPPGTALSLPKSHNRESNSEEKKTKKSGPWFWGSGGWNPSSRGFSLFCGGQDPLTEDHFGGAVSLFCRQLPLVGPAVLVGQEAEKCRGPVPGVSPAGALPSGCSPPGTPKLPQHQHHPKFLCWGDTRASCGPPNRHPVPRGLSGQRVGICAVSPEVLSPQILPPASAN